MIAVVGRIAGISLLCVLSCASGSAGALTLQASGDALRVEITGTGREARERILIYSASEGAAGRWVEALSAPGGAMRVDTAQGSKICVLTYASEIANGLRLSGDCGIGQFEQRIVFSDEKDALNVATRLVLSKDLVVHSVEDRYSFVPKRHVTQDAKNGPLDFVWSQNIKSEADDLIPSNAFKSPAVMMQQGAVFAAIIPTLAERSAADVQKALDLNMSSEQQPWMSFGAVATQPHGHSYFRRDANGQLKIVGRTVEYSYSIVASEQPEKLGYRRITRRLWSEYGHPGLLNSPELQRNVVHPELSSFDSWRADAWQRYADTTYKSFECGGKRCGTLTSDRNVTGDWEKAQPDAWFNAWFETLRTAYGWYVHGRATGDAAMMAKAESVLTLALSAPQKDGAFPTIYLLRDHRWVADDGWAGYKDDYHAFCMSWTAYWMLRWAADLAPERKPEVLKYVRGYGDFLLREQLPSGVIPSWYGADLKPRAEFRDFNAETTASALLLVTLGSVSGDAKYTAGAERAMQFVSDAVVPRQRWFDFETYLSCARKDYGFYDHWTEQYPQNNLAEIQAPEAWLALYRATGKRIYLERGSNALDYLLLTQQVWSPPMFTPNLLGGFTTQNTDAEWSDARQSYAAMVLFDYFRETQEFEYLERAVAAARSTFAVAPWENWAHTGYVDEHGALTGFHWGTGSAMTSVEMMSPLLGDGYIDLREERGVGFDECTIRKVQVTGDRITFELESKMKQRSFVLRFAHVDPERTYRVSWNSGAERRVEGRELIAHGLQVSPLIAAN